MRLDDIKRHLDATDVPGSAAADEDIQEVCGSDLLSDVLASGGAGSLLLTGLTNTQVVRTAEIVEIAAVCFVRGKRPQDETVDMAREVGLPLMTTRLSMFEACGRLHANGLRGCDSPDESR